MNPWPRYITDVSDHALVRYLGRIEGWDIGHVANWLRQGGDEVTDRNILWAMEQAGLDIQAARWRVLQDADAGKRDARLQERSSDLFLVPGGKSDAKYLVSQCGAIVTTLTPVGWLKRKYRKTRTITYAPGEPVPA